MTGHRAVHYVRPGPRPLPEPRPPFNAWNAVWATWFVALGLAIVWLAPIGNGAITLAGLVSLMMAVPFIAACVDRSPIIDRRRKQRRNVNK